MLTKSVILIIMVWVQGSSATVTEHQFSSMKSCQEAQSKAMMFRSGMMSSDVHAFCVDK